MQKCVHQELLLNNHFQEKGTTLIEIIVVLVILSVLAGAALPYAEVTIRRSKEIELRNNLREIRTAIDLFHYDWESGLISKSEAAASDDGYPKTLSVLVDGVETTGVSSSHKYYLRRIPKDPFSPSDKSIDEQWHLRSYQDEPSSLSWGGHDVYDVMTLSEKRGIDGSFYKTW